MGGDGRQGLLQGACDREPGLSIGHALRRRCGDAEGVSDDTNEMTAGYTRENHEVNGSHSVCHSVARPSCKCHDHALRAGDVKARSRARRTRASGSQRRGLVRRRAQREDRARDGRRPTSRGAPVADRNGRRFVGLIGPHISVHNRGHVAGPPSRTTQRPHARPLRTGRHQGVNDPFSDSGRSGDDAGVVHALVHVNAVSRRAPSGRHRTPPLLSCSIGAQIAVGFMRCPRARDDRCSVRRYKNRLVDRVEDPG
jgi:hypothetical protein